MNVSLLRKMHKNFHILREDGKWIVAPKSAKMLRRKGKNIYICKDVMTGYAITSGDIVRYENGIEYMLYITLGKYYLAEIRARRAQRSENVEWRAFQKGLKVKIAK